MNFNNQSLFQNNKLTNNNPQSQSSKELELKNQKGAKRGSQAIDNQRGRNTRQFGSDITNLNNNGSNNLTGQTIEIKKKPLSRKGSTSSRKVSKQQDLRAKKTIKGVPNLSVNDSAKQMKLEIGNNSFKGSSMILDEPVMTRNQCSEKLIHNNPQLALEYLESIILTLFETEQNPKNTSFYPFENYMKLVQKDINDKMRVILFDWLVDVHLKWKLLPDTLFLTFNIIDRYLGMKPTPRDELQCIGVAGLLIACKYEEIYFPEISDFVEITDNAFSQQEILKKEIDVLGVLKYDLTVPSALRFFEVFNVYLKLEGKEKAAVMFLIELCCFDFQMIKYKPSLIATGCLMLMVSHNRNLKETLFINSCYNNDQIALFCKDMINVYYKPDHGSKALTRKYSQSKFYEIGKMDIIAELTMKHNQSQNMSN